MSDALERAYAALHLTPGASWEEVQASYKTLVKTWHPDLFRTPQEKERAEAYLKEIIAARALLKEHFKYFRREKIEESPVPRPGPGPGPGPGPDRQTEPQAKPQAKPQADPQTKAKPKPEEPPDFWSDLCKNLDLGPLTHDEPGWYETFRRACDKVSGKHPGETILDYFEKPVDWSRNHKKRCLILTMFLIAIFDRVVVSVQEQDKTLPPTSQSTQSSSSSQSAEQSQAPQPTARLDFDSEAEKRREYEYFENKWRERTNREHPSGL